MEQRAKEMGKTAEIAVYRAYIEKMKKKNKDRCRKKILNLLIKVNYQNLFFKEVDMEKIMICIICIYLCLVQCLKEYFQKKLEVHFFM